MCQTNASLPQPLVRADLELLLQSEVDLTSDCALGLDRRNWGLRLGTESSASLEATAGLGAETVEISGSTPAGELLTDPTHHRC